MPNLPVCLSFTILNDGVSAHDFAINLLEKVLIPIEGLQLCIRVQLSLYAANWRHHKKLKSENRKNCTIILAPGNLHLSPASLSKVLCISLCQVDFWSRLKVTCSNTNGAKKSRRWRFNRPTWPDLEDPSRLTRPNSHVYAWRFYASVGPCNYAKDG